jgi:hypothetical protein
VPGCNTVEGILPPAPDPADDAINFGRVIANTPREPALCESQETTKAAPELGRHRPFLPEEFSEQARNSEEPLFQFTARAARPRRTVPPALRSPGTPQSGHVRRHRANIAVRGAGRRAWQCGDQCPRRGGWLTFLRAAPAIIVPIETMSAAFHALSFSKSRSAHAPPLPRRKLDSQR